MSDDSQPAEIPPTPESTPPSSNSTPAVPAGSPAQPGRATPPASAASAPAQSAGTTPPLPPGASAAPMPSRPDGPPIDIIMPAPKKPFTIPPYAGCLVKMIFGFTFLLVLGYCALVALNPKAQKWATQGGADGSGGPTPFKAVNQLLALPAQAVGKTKNVVAASDARVGVLDNVIAEDEKKNGKGGKGAVESKPLTDPFSTAAPTPGKSAARAAAAAAEAGGGEPDNRVSRQAILALAAKGDDDDGPPKPILPKPVAPTVAPPPPGPAEMKLAGGVVLRNSSPAGVPPASAPFMYWAAGLNVSGVSTSTPPRFLMNGKLVVAGDEVNRQLGVVFERLDSAAKLIYFKDKTGAVVTRSY